MGKELKCQMTVGEYTLVSGSDGYGKCGRPAKYRVPVVKMGVEFVCGIHAKSLDKMFQKTHRHMRCEPIRPLDNSEA